MIAAALFWLAVAADVLTTRWALGHGAREGNPLLAAAGRWWILVRLALSLVIFVVAWASLPSEIRTLALACFALAWGAIAFWNVIAVVEMNR